MIRSVCLSVVATFVLLGNSSPGHAAAKKGRPPNIVLILADDVGCEVLGCYGGQSYRTPHLDALARSGMRFTHAYSMPVCHPTRVCLLTGRYPFHLDHPRWGSFPKAEEKHTLAQVLKRAGYATAIAGKWQLGLLKNDLEQPQRMGFDDYALFGWHEGPRYYQPLIWQNGKKRDDVTDRYGPEVYCDFLIDFVTRHQKKLFFAFYSMALCHDVTDDLKEPVPYGPHGRYDSYKEMAEAMDVQVGRLVAALDRLKLRDNTLILFTGDNGTASGSIIRAEDGKYIRDPVYSRINGQRLRGGKGKLTDGGTNVPLLASWKGTIPPGQVVDDLVDFSDFLPTCAALAEAKLPEGVQLDGHSFAPRLAGKKGYGRSWAYAERGKRWWVRNQRWKLYNDGQLFDLKMDPQEKKAIRTDTPTSARARKQLQQALAAVRPAGK
jgi:arylsulfatase A